MNYLFLLDLYACFAAIGVPPLKIWKDTLGIYCIIPNRPVIISYIDIE